MPQELLGAVLCTGDAAGRSRRRWLFPLSLAAHAAAGFAIVVIPLMAEVELPTPASPFAGRWIRVESRPLPVIPRAAPPTTMAVHDAAPITPPSTIEPEVSRPPSGLSVPGALDVRPGVPTGVPGSVARVGEPVAPPPAPEPPQAPRKPLPIGGVIRAPTKLVDVPPVYPPMAVAAHVEGIVILEAVIDERGRVDDVRVLRSITLLDNAAMDAVRSWRYTPTLLNGKPVPVLMTVTVRFSLQR